MKAVKVCLLTALLCGGLLSPAAHAQKNLQQLLKKLLPAKGAQQSVEKKLLYPNRTSLEAVAFSKTSNYHGFLTAARSRRILR